MSLKQDVNVQGPLYLNEQQLALADVSVCRAYTLPTQIRDHFIRIRESETPGDDQAQASIAVRSRTKFIAFMVNRVLTKEQVEHQRELRDLPSNLDCRREPPTILHRW